MIVIHWFIIICSFLIESYLNVADASRIEHPKSAFRVFLFEMPSPKLAFLICLIGLSPTKTIVVCHEINFSVFEMPF